MSDPTDPEAKRLSYSLHGLQQATLRCDQSHWHRPEDAFTAAAEAVSWAVSLDRALMRSTEGGRDPEAYKLAREQSSDGKTVIGMTFVRDHVQHARELLDFVQLMAVVGNSTYGMRAGWMWAPLEDVEPLLDPAFESGKGLYREFLAGKPVVHTLLDANQWFGSVTPPLPSLPPDETGEERPVFEFPERWPPIEGDRRV